MFRHHPDSLPDDPLPDPSDRQDFLAGDFSFIDLSLLEGYDGLVDSLMFEALMRFDGDDIFPSLGMLNQRDTSGARSTSTVFKSSGPKTTSSLTLSSPGGSSGSTGTPSLTLSTPGGSSGSTGTPSLTLSTPGGSSGSTGTSVSGSTGTSSEDKLRYISKYLVQIIPSATPKTTKTSLAGKRVSGARILTSAQCTAILQEREEKKRKEREEKEKRKAAREQKKIEREEAVKKKAKDRKAKQEAAKKKAEEKARKAAEKAAERGTRSSKRQNSRFQPATKKQKSTSKESPSSASTSGAPAATTSTEATAEINTDECCICFRTCTFADDEREETGLEWVECACKRWLHEHCIDYDIVVGSDGKELLCQYCVV